MRNCNILEKIALSLPLLAMAVAAIAGGCTREGDSTLGYEFLPENQRLEMRHRTFRLGTVRMYDADSDEYTESTGHQFFKTTHYRTDSLVSSNLQTGYFGAQRDPDGVFGLRTAGFASEFLFNSTPDAEKGFGYLPIFDSMMLMLSITDMKGDTLMPMRYEVYEVNAPLNDCIAEGDDSVAYINYDMSQLYDEQRLLFTFTFPDPDNGVDTGAEYVKMEPADVSKNGATWDFVRRLMLVEELDEGWDGYADDLTTYTDPDKWISTFKGLYIKPAEAPADGEEGAVFATDLSASGIYLYGRNRNPDEPRLIKDTLEMNYVFYNAKVTAAGNHSINSITHNYTGTVLETAMSNPDPACAEGRDVYEWRTENRQNHTESATVYVEGMGGVATELYFTDDFLAELRKINVDENFGKASINQALIYLYLEGSDYDWGNIDPAAMTPLIESAPARLGLYTSLEDHTPVPDYNYYYEANYNTSLNYDGYIKRSLACYVMDISSWMQQLKNYIDVLNPDAEESFDYESAFKSTDDKFVSRLLYIAPDAYSMYTFRRAALQGMEDAANNASIRLELTYTMIK